MKPLNVLAALFAASILGVKATAQQQVSQKKIVQKWKTICANCHGEKGRGDGPAAGAMTPPPANFTSPKWQKGITDEEIFRVIKEGKGMMPRWDGVLSDAEIHALVRYIRQLGKNSSSPQKPRRKGGKKHQSR